MPLSFPFADYWWFYAAFSALVLLLLAVDLGVFHRTAHAVSFRESLGLKMVWLNDLFDGKFPIGWSLAIIGALLFGSVVASWLWPPTHGRAAPTPMGEEAR